MLPIRRGAIVLAILWTLCLTAQAGGQQVGEPPAKVVEPVLTEETLPNEPGELSLRVTMDYRRRGTESIAALPRIDLFYGLAERLGAELSVQRQRHRGDGSTAVGLGDASLGMKYVAVEHGQRSPAVVFGIELELPTGNSDRELGEGAFAVTPFVALLKDLNRFSIQGNFGWSKEVDRERHERVTYDWALAVPVLERQFHLLVELNGDWGPQPQAAIAPGLKYRLSDDLSIGVAVPLRLNANTPGWGVVTQFQFAF